MNSDSLIPDLFSPVNCSPEKLLHDMQMRQIELEVQNEYLQSDQIKHEESEAYYADLFNNAPIGYLVLSDKGLISDINITAAKLFGIDRQDLLSSRFTNLVTAQHSNRWYLFCRELKNHKQQHNMTLLLKGCGNTEVSVRLDCLRINSTLRIMLNEVTTAKQLIPDASSTELLLTACVEKGKIINEASTRPQNITNEALEQSYQYLQLAIISGQVGIWQYNLQTHEVIWDDTMFALYGSNRKDFSGAYNAWSDRLHPDDRKATEAALQDAISGKSNYTPDFRVIWANGEVHHLKGHAHVVTDKAGTPQYMIGTNSDNNAFAHTHKQLLFARAAINNSNSTFICLTPDGHVADVNDFACISLGYTHNELIGLPVWDFDSEMSMESWSDSWATLKKSGKYQGERFYRRKNGTIFPVKVNSDLMDINGTEYNFSFVKDITEHKQLENKLSDSHTFSLNIINSLTSYIAVLDTEGNIVVTNKAYRRFGEQNSLPETLMNMPGLNCVAICKNNQGHLCKEQENAAQIGIAKVLSGKRDMFELEYQCNLMGQSFWFHLKALRVQNSFNFVMMIYDDITERKQRELTDKEHLDQLAHVTRLGLMGEMAAGLAHEVNQPLTAIATYAQVNLIQIKKENPDLIKLGEVAVKIQEQVLRAGQIIHGMKRFCTSTSQQRSTVDINELINKCVNLCAYFIKQNSIAVRLELPNNLPAIYVDHIQIEQVLINLIRNSIDAILDIADRQQGEITIQSHLTLDNKIQVSVKDNGPGIEDDQQSKILTPFHTTKTDGMGMGLSISSSLIEAHDGKLNFDSQFGKGSTFYFTLPID
jgi:PAS domain S-box-containing protein